MKSMVIVFKHDMTAAGYGSRTVYADTPYLVEQIDATTLKVFSDHLPGGSARVFNVRWGHDYTVRANAEAKAG